MAKDSIFLVDLDKILKDKAGNNYKFIPRFFRSYLKRLVHQDEVNDCITVNAGKEGVPFLKGCMDYLDNQVNVKGEENLPDSNKRYTFVSNHPLGAMDGISIGYILGTHYEGKIKYLVNDILMNLHGLAPLCVPINKTGAQSRDFPQMVKETFASRDHVIMFPAGVCSRRINGVIQDLPWKKTFITESVRSQRDVVPMHFDGRNSERFYKVANLFNFKWMKFNPAMVLLPDEMMKNQHKTFTLTIGKPIPWQTFDKSRTPLEWAQYVREIVYTL